MWLADTTCYLFDLNGTLVDSSPVHERAYRHILGREYPHLLPGFDYRAIAGLATLETFRSLRLSENDSRHCTLLKQSHYREAVAAGAVREMTGAKAMLALLKARGTVIGVVTSASHASALKTLDATGLAQHVDTIVTADDVTGDQTRRDALSRRADAAESRSPRAVAIEDAPSGIASAQAAGLNVIGMHDETVRLLSDLYFADFAAFAGALA